VLVCRIGTRRCVAVRLNDYCPCRQGRRPKLIDLSDEAFAWLGRRSAGVYRVVVEGFR
jgi:rare lipoprotein A (peptidoglycan hydrolase)